MATFGALKHRSTGAVWAAVALGIVYTLYNTIQTDSCYTFRVIGWNIPLLNIYSRIIEVHKE